MLNAYNHFSDNLTVNTKVCQLLNTAIFETLSFNSIVLFTSFYLKVN